MSDGKWRLTYRLVELLHDNTINDQPTVSHP